MYLGIDLGTSGVKVCVLRDDGSVAEIAGTPLHAHHPFDGASEQNCTDWWAACCSAVTSLAPNLRSAIRAVGLSGQMHGAVALDRTGAPVRPVMLWNDARATQECADMADAHRQAAEIAGVPPMAGFTAPKVLWLARHEPEAHARIAHVLLPKDYIGYRLHGQFVTDPSDAAGTSMLDQRTRQWSKQICAICDTNPEWLPEIKFGTEVAGLLQPDAAMALGLPDSVPVATGAGDAAAGAIGIGAISPGDGFISLGTSGQLFVSTPDYRPNTNRLIHAYAHTLPDLWFQMAAMLNGARPLAWLAQLLNRPLTELLAAAAVAEPGPVFLPYLTGERTPHGDPNIRGGFSGLGETTTPGSLMRSVVEAVAFTFADASDAFEDVGTRNETLLAIGGGTKSDFLMQTIANVTGCLLGRSDDAAIGPALGAARMACVAEGGRSLQDVMTKPAVATWFTPNADEAEKLKVRLASFRALYPALRTAQSRRH